MDRIQLKCKKGKEVPREKNPLYLSSEKNYIDLSSRLTQYLSSAECNLDNICRICLIISKKPLYTLSSIKWRNSFADTFKEMTSIRMCREDGLPTRVCLSCQAEVMRFAKFKMKCEESDNMLKNILKFGSTKCEPQFHRSAVLAEQDILNIKKEDSNHLDIIGHKEFDDCSSQLTNDDEELFIVQNTFDNKKSDVLAKEDLNIKKGDRNHLDIIKFKEFDDCYEELKNVLSDDEELLIVQNTFNNEKKITIYDRGPKTLTKNNGDKNKKKKFKHDCTLCSKGFNTLRLLKAHENRYHGGTEDPFPCDRCKETFAAAADLTLHALVHDRTVPPWECTNCQKLFQDKAMFRRHIQRHMSRKKFPCPQCGKTFAERCALRRHARVHTGQRPDKRHKCTHCGKLFIDNTQLTAHMSHHGGEKSFQCIVCGKAFATQRLLTSHLVVHSETKPYACRYCDKRFRHESTRNTHHHTHTGERPYVCAVCGKRFIQNSNLRVHTRTHTGERPYSCGECGRKFSSGSTLKSHARTHSGERPYSCDVCGKRFARANMKLHMSVHSGARPFPCAACPRRFRAAALLRDHTRTHTGEEPFECAMCKSTYSSKVLLIKHLKKHENDKRHRKRKPPQLPTPFKPPEQPASLKPQQSASFRPPQQPTSETPQIEENKSFLALPNCYVEEIPNAIMELTLDTHETFNVREDLILQDNNVKTHVIVLGTNSNTVRFVSDGVDSELNIVTIDEVGVSISSNTNG